jgi:glycosyltransferase involved in cell wall biosynthesis
LQAYEAILSIATQNNKNFKLIISDNSSDGSLEDMLNQHILNSDQINFDYRKRDKVYSAVDHGNLCLNEVDTDYFCLFHDDDLMLPNFVENFWAVLKLNPQMVSCGMNAYIENLNSQENKSKRLFFKDFRRYIGPISPKNLIEKYFGRNQLGIAPYPSYIYKKSALEKMRFTSEDGKYGDVTWLLRVSAMGPMIWVNLPSMIYRIHDGNYSMT